MNRLQRLVRDPPAVIKSLMMQFYQSWGYDFKTDEQVSKALIRMIDEMGPAERRELRPIINYLQENATPAELRTVFRKAGSDILFDSKGSVWVFETWAARLEHHND